MGAYPAAPDFQTGQYGNAWWTSHAGDGSTLICLTQGKTFIKQLQFDLVDADRGGILTASFDGPDGTQIPTSQIGNDGNMGHATTGALWRVLTDKAAAGHTGLSSDIAAIAADFARNTPGVAGNQFSTGTIHGAIWYAFHQDLDPSKVELASNAILPRWNVAPAEDAPNSGSVACYTAGAVPSQPNIDPRTGTRGGVPVGTAGAAHTTIGTPNPVSVGAGSTTGGPSWVLLAWVGGGVLVVGTGAYVATHGKHHRKGR